MRSIVVARNTLLKSFLCLFLLIVTLTTAIGCEQNDKPAELALVTAESNSQESVVARSSGPEEEPPLLLDDEPLLLMEDDSATAESEGPIADNARCFVCHANYLGEKIAVTHARANIGCADCHGPSDAHIADESWGSGGNGTAPDIMYPREKINPACTECHPKDKIDTPQHEPVFAAGSEAKVCTDCHGDHRLAVRRCTWK